MLWKIGQRVCCRILRQYSSQPSGRKTWNWAAIKSISLLSLFLLSQPPPACQTGFLCISVPSAGRRWPTYCSRVYIYVQITSANRIILVQILNYQEIESDPPHLGSDVQYWASQLWVAAWGDVINTVGGVESSSEREGNSQSKMSHYELGR